MALFNVCKSKSARVYVSNMGRLILWNTSQLREGLLQEPAPRRTPFTLQLNLNSQAIFTVFLRSKVLPAIFKKKKPNTGN